MTVCEVRAIGRGYILNLGAAVASLLIGCQPPASPPPQPTASTWQRPAVSLAQRAQPAAPGAPQDAPAARQWLFQVDVYQLAVPRDTFSNNDEFWKRMDEECVDSATHDVLYKNGIRVGIAPIAEVAHFRKFMDETIAVHKMSISGARAKNIELEMKKDLPGQTISQFDHRNALAMRDYDRSSNVINLSFAPAPRKPGCLRLSLCPMVRTHRRHFEFSALHEEREIQYVAPEMLYDLNLRVDVPKDRFFIVMPSPAADESTSVGRAFLTRDGPTELQEQILLVIPYPAIIQDDR